MTDKGVTPRIFDLLCKIEEHSSEIQKKIDSIKKRFQQDDCLVLRPAVENIVDRNADKERHKKRWKIEIKDVVESYFAYDAELK